MSKEYLIKGESLTALADKIRVLKGITEPMGLDDMAIELETIPKNDSSDLTVSGATVTVPVGYYSSSATKSVATATQATPSIAINASGLITATASQTAGYVAAGTTSATKQLAFQAAKTITPSTTSQIAVSSGYYTGGDITVAAIPSTYIKPSYTKAATTYTPTTANQNISAGTYCSGVQTIKGDSNLVAGNIKSGVSIFGVNGTYVGSGGGTSNEDGLIARTTSTYTNNTATAIGSYAFYSNSKLTKVSFSNVTTIGTRAFEKCNSLTTVSFPKVTTIDSYAFSYCHSLTTVSFPKVTTIGSCAFTDCAYLTTVRLPMVATIGSLAFDYNYRLKSLYLTGSSLCVLSNSNAFRYTPISNYSNYAGGYGTIYVPASLLASYKAATNWTYYSSRFVGV